jgi:protein TonB
MPARPEESPLPRADVPLIVDTAWYTAKDLDLYPRALARVEPVYSLSAADVSGEVLLQLMIDESGAVSEATVVKAEPAGYFEESALQAFKVARFSPAQRDGHAVRSRVVVKVRFAPQMQASAGR